MSQQHRSTSSLSPQRAFVVQFYERAEGQAEPWAGRAEHISSGRATRFQSSEALWTFFTEILTTLNEKPP
ncbi:MAG TPA: hypothetical protein VGX03_32580 [Candidatus Binatia bacterium]|nr:hypothetical protein [Candidatus Binatia bacterium]